MKLNHKIHIDMLDFLKTGKFDYVALGQSQEWLSANFANPTDIGNLGDGIEIWRYGVIEFYFDNKELYQIYCDNFTHTKLTAGDDIMIYPWIFNDYSKHKLTTIIKILINQNINFKKTIKHDAICLILQSGVMLYFNQSYKKSKPSQYRLSAFCYSQSYIDEFGQ